MKILLVDDDAFLRDMYATKFTESGDKVSVAKSGEEALHMIKEESYDAVIVDMVMPGITGSYLVKEVVDNKNICIVLSNQGEQTDIDAAKRAGAVGYIIKADSIPSEVVKKVHTLLK